MSEALPSLFDAAKDGSEAYLACRDHSTKEHIKARFENAFALLAHLLPEGPEHFADELRRDFFSRAWELYLLAVLHGAGLHLEAHDERGPDILLRLSSGKRCWIEGKRCTERRSGTRSRRRACSRPWMAFVQRGEPCSLGGGGTVMGPRSRSSSAGTMRPRVASQYLGASSRYRSRGQYGTTWMISER